MNVHFTPEDIPSLARAIAALEAERDLLERHRMHSVELGLAIDDLTMLRDRMVATEREYREKLAARTSFPKLEAVS